MLVNDKYYVNIVMCVNIILMCDKPENELTANLPGKLGRGFPSTV